jgi:ParB family chromosome partitioning protein
MSDFFKDAIFWVEVDKIKPNPFQPRREFDEEKLKDLSESIKVYGVLQPLVVTRKEIEREDGGLVTEYELISGERRLRAARLAGLSQVPVLIRSKEQTDLEKLELAILENLQREDLNAIDRARAFERLVKEFGLKHADIARKLGRSREYVSNSLRILLLPDDMVNAVAEGHITEGHTRPLLMLSDRVEEQRTLFKEIVLRKLSVREAENLARRIAYDRVRKKDKNVDPEMFELEEKFKETLGTRVHIERKEIGGKISIDFFSTEDLLSILEMLKKGEEKVRSKDEESKEVSISQDLSVSQESLSPTFSRDNTEDDEDLYSIKNFTI